MGRKNQKRQTEMSKQLEEKCKSLKALESRRLTELRNQLQEKQLESEQVWSKLTNTWAAEKITKDTKIDELKAALEMAREQQLATEQAWKTAIEEEKLEKLAQVNKLVERVKGMEVKQHKIRQDMERKLRNVQEQAQEKYQKSVRQMQEEYQMKLEQEVQRYTSGQSQREKIDPIARKAEDKLISQQRALETAKRMLHQGRGEAESPEMDWDYYGVQNQTAGQPQHVRGAQIPGRVTGERKELPKRAASTPLEEESYSRSYGTFGLSAVGKQYSCENCQKKHEPPLCACPNCEGPHLISKCPFSGIPEGETVPKTKYVEPWSRCDVCYLCHQGTCPCARCGELAHIAADCVVAGMEDWSKIPTTKQSRQDQVSPEKRKSQTTVEKMMWCGKCGVSHPQNESCKYPDVSKSLWCPTCGGRQNDHIKGCPVQRGTSILQVCKRCEGEGHTQENCTATGVPCYKCGEMGHLADECTQMGRFALRHQIYDPSPRETRPYCYRCKEEGHITENCAQASGVPERENEKDRYQEAYKELCQRDPIASMDETTTEYPSQDYRQLDQLLEERRHLRERTPRRDLDKKKYQPRRLIEQGKIDLGLPRTAWTPHRDSASHEIYPIPEDEEERGSNNQ